MRIVEITYSLGRTIQMEQFQPVSFHASIKAEVGEEDINKAFTELKKIVAKQINEDIGKVREVKQKKEFPYGACSLCGKPLARSKKGDLYCPNSFSDTPNNPHKSKPTLSENEQTFVKSLEEIK